MSRIGKKIIPVPSGVNVQVNQQEVIISGKLGTLTREFHPDVEIVHSGTTLSVAPRIQNRNTPALWGLSRSLLANMVHGVSQGFTKNLSIIGVGYRAAVIGNTLKLGLGYSHDVEFAIPAGISITVDKNTLLAVQGADREKIGQLCAEIRSKRSPEPYKGKGVRYADEVVAMKVGKKKKK